MEHDKHFFSRCLLFLKEFSEFALKSHCNIPHPMSSPGNLMFDISPATVFIKLLHTYSKSIYSFICRTCDHLKGLSGEQMFNLTKSQLQKFCGLDDGHRLYSQLLLSRTVTQVFILKLTSFNDYYFWNYVCNSEQDNKFVLKKQLDDCLETSRYFHKKK